MENIYRLKIYDTKNDHKYDADRIYEFLGDRNSIFYLWFKLKKELGNKHVEVFNLDGDEQIDIEKGIDWMG